MNALELQTKLFQQIERRIGENKKLIDECSIQKDQRNYCLEFR